VLQIPADDQCPDSCFLEDTALVLDEIAVLTRPGSDARRAEVTGVAPAFENIARLCRSKRRRRLKAAMCCVLDGTCFVGVTTRTTSEGIEALRKHVEPFG